MGKTTMITGAALVLIGIGIMYAGRRLATELPDGSREWTGINALVLILGLVMAIAGVVTFWNDFVVTVLHFHR